MKISMQTRLGSVALLLLILFIASVCPAANSADDLSSARSAIGKAMADLGINKDDSGILLLTNAYYGQVNQRGAEQYRDLLSELTGCTSGKRSLLDVHTPFNEPLWFALWQKSTNRLVFCRWKDGSFASQVIEVAPEKILQADAWKQASHGAIGAKTMYQVASIGLCWAAGADWPILKSAGFHGELPPGVAIGYLFHSVLEKRMAREKGDEWLFFGALPKCYMDTLQMVYNTTLGKQQAFGVSMSKEQLSKYKTKGAMPCVVALKVNRSKDSCRGMVLGFSRKRVMKDLGVREADIVAKGGVANPIFCIARITASMRMVKMKPEDREKWIVEMRRFSGDGKLVNRICNAGGDPYAIVWAR